MNALAQVRGELSVVQLPDPEPAAGEVRVRVVHAATNPADWKVLGGGFLAAILHGRAAPLVVGYDFFGVVDRVGAGASVAPGTAVAGFLPYGRETLRGTYAELVVTRPDRIVAIPDGFDPRVAAAFPTGGATALQGLRDLGRLKPGGRVLVVGAAGGVGSMAVGVANALGAHVTGVCSTAAVDYVRGLGADAVIDRSKEDPLATTGRYDILLDAAAAWTYAGARHLLAPGGAFVSTLPSASLFWGKALAAFAGRTCDFITVKPIPADFTRLLGFIGAGMTVEIDSVVPVRDVAAALIRQQQGGIRGKIVVDVEGGW